MTCRELNCGNEITKQLKVNQDVGEELSSCFWECEREARTKSDQIYCIRLSDGVKDSSQEIKIGIDILLHF